MGPKCNKFSFFFSTIGEGWGEEWRPAAFYIRHLLLNEQSERQGTKVNFECLCLIWVEQGALNIRVDFTFLPIEKVSTCSKKMQYALHKVAHLVSGTGSEFDMEMTINQVMITTGNPGTILHLTTVLQGGHWHQVW